MACLGGFNPVVTGPQAGDPVLIPTAHTKLYSGTVALQRFESGLDHMELRYRVSHAYEPKASQMAREV